MSRRLIFTLAIFLLCAGQFQAQTTTTAQNYIVQVSTSEPWTDAGLDLQPGDAVEISAAASSISGSPACDPKGVSAPSAELPLPSAPAGALIARLHAQGAVPLLVGAATELQIKESSHLFLGMNMAGAAPCQGTLTVKVHAIPAGSSASSTASSDDQQKTRGSVLKSQLGTAAQVFMQGQFGFGKSDTSAANATTAGDASTPTVSLKVSDAPLDADLRKSLDTLPRRVNDQFQNLGDMVNFVLIGSQRSEE